MSLGSDFERSLMKRWMLKYKSTRRQFIADLHVAEFGLAVLTSEEINSVDPGKQSRLIHEFYAQPRMHWNDFQKKWGTLGDDWLAGRCIRQAFESLDRDDVKIDSDIRVWANQERNC